MARIFITGSTDGLGRAAAGTLISDGHEVVLHARSRERASAFAAWAAANDGTTRAAELVEQLAEGGRPVGGRDDDVARPAGAPIAARPED